MKYWFANPSDQIYVASLKYQITQICIDHGFASQYSKKTKVNFQRGVSPNSPNGEYATDQEPKFMFITKYCLKLL